LEIIAFANNKRHLREIYKEPISWHYGF
jgi:hypothetical protein